jgi:hypothetical protein
MHRWRLPGTQGYISSVVRALRSGFNVVSGVPNYGASGLGDALRCHLMDEGWIVTGHLPDASLNPLDQLYSTMEIPDQDSSCRSISTLLGGLEPGAVVIIDGIKHDKWAEWKQFFATYEAASRGIPRSDRPLLLAIVEGVPSSELGRDCAALKVLIWQNVVGEFDIMLFVLESLRNRINKPSKARLLSRIIARLSLWDFELASCLAEVDERLLFEPIDSLNSVVQSLPVPDGLAASWEAGGMMLFDDVSLLHPYLLLADASKHAMLRRRLWEAQASDLLPLLETRRHYWAQQLRTIIRTPIRLGEQTFEDIDELEIGQLAILAKQHNLKPQIRHATDTLRRYRNKLAHIEPLAYSEAFDDDLQSNNMA